jgi:hypothetical protein
MSATPFIVAGIQWLFNHFSSPPSDLRKAHLWEAPWWLWALSLMGCFAFAQFLAWRDEHKHCKALNETMENREQEYRSNLLWKDALLMLSANPPAHTGALTQGASTVSAPEIAIGATLRVPMTDGDVLVGNLRRCGSKFMGSIYVRVRSGFLPTATVLIRMDVLQLSCEGAGRLKRP